MRLKRGNVKTGLKLNIKKKTKILATVPIASWEIVEEETEAASDFIFLDSKVTHSRQGLQP